MTEDFSVRSAEMDMTAEIFRKNRSDMTVYIDIDADAKPTNNHDLVRKYCKNMLVNLKNSDGGAKLLNEIGDSTCLISVLVTEREDKYIRQLAVSASERGIRTEVRERY